MDPSRAAPGSEARELGKKLRKHLGRPMHEQAVALRRGIGARHKFRPRGRWQPVVRVRDERQREEAHVGHIMVSD